MALFETKYEKKSATITAVISGLILILLFLFGFTYLDPPPENGIAVNFGTSDVGSGDIQPTEPVQSAPQQNTAQPTPPQPTETTPEVKDEVVTQDTETAPVIEKEEEKKVEKEQPKEQPKENPVETTETPKEVKETKEVKKPDPKPDKNTSDALNSLINGPKKDGQANGGEGNDNQPGDKGDPNGDPNASSYYGQGKGLDGDGNYRLGGRKALNKEKFVQDCNESGVVVVKIEVNQRGQVINAVPGAKGTTNNASCLMEPARRAALATKFNSDADAPVKQTGYIEYEFKLSE
ncbi:energy transducer TonB [Mesonia sp.]|uniref:energy transducer TonB n=1 Tax=Mesonia sp. TaxID=1960830 RepID=UPI00175CEB32|nr:energy transducer TonB [Mesonia sp.]HIB38480.1 energy transducer TonB [Mesonia sp.]HIO27140.1 energy transducer TonB [Flavobacteriaceae bacterium]